MSRLSKVIIQLDSLDHNVALLKRLSEPSEIMAVVKANAYGHGVENIVPFLLKKGIRYFGVANIYESIELRKLFTNEKFSVLCLGYIFPSDFVKLLSFPTETSIFDKEHLNKILSFSNQAKKIIDVHLKINTGMERLGCKPENSLELALQIGRAEFLNLKGIYTHFAKSENDDHFTQIQLDLFLSYATRIEKELGYTTIKHISNSGGVLYHPEANLDLVRPGISLYGYEPKPRKKNSFSLSPVMKLVSYVVFIKAIKKGTHVSYGGTWVAGSNTTIATVSIGYADGFPRLASNKAMVSIKGKLFKQVGTVTMDMILVDINNDSSIKVGDEVTIFGSEFLTAEKLASLSGTISYELLTSISSNIIRYLK